MKDEFRAWENSMEYMYKVLNDQDIPSDAGIAIEYNIPQTSKRVDFLISGYGKKEDANVVLIELKQWDELEAIPGRDGLVQTYTGNAVRQVVHPSYQAWSYTMLISDYNASVQEGMISIFPCAYLHNYRRHEHDPIDAEQYGMIRLMPSSMKYIWKMHRHLHAVKLQSLEILLRRVSGLVIIKN